MEIIRGKIKSAQKVVIYGPEGIGKSTFASKFPNPIFSDTEGSTKKLDVARLPKPSSWTMLMEQARYIKANPQICRSYVIDTADWAEHLCVDHICAKSKTDGIEGFGYGKGYTYLEEEFGRLLNLLEDIVGIGINVVITAHAQMRKFEQPDEMGAYDRWELKLEKKTAALVKEWADMLLFANYKTYVINVDNQGTAKGKNKAQGGSRVMYTTHHPCWDAKNRDDLAPELPFDYQEIAPYILAKENEINQMPRSNAKEKIEAVVDPEPAKTTYWHDEPKKRVFILKPGEPFPPDSSDFLLEISSDEYVKIAKQYVDSIAQNPPKGVPTALWDLMKSENVTEEEVQEAVYAKGYYPKNTPIENYDPQFVDGVLIGAWAQVFEMIKENRKLPF